MIVLLERNFASYFETVSLPLKEQTERLTNLKKNSNRFFLIKINVDVSSSFNHIDIKTKFMDYPTPPNLIVMKQIYTNIIVLKGTKWILC